MTTVFCLEKEYMEIINKCADMFLPVIGKDITYG